MQTSKVRSAFKFNPLKEIIRTVTVSSNTTCANPEFEQLKPWKEIPGPTSWPIVGQLIHALPGGEMHDLDVPGGLQKLFDKYGPMVRINALLGMKPMVILGDPELSAHVLRSENTYPVRPGFHSMEYYRREFKESRGEKVLTTGLITEHGEKWKDLRSTVNPVLLQPKTIKLYCNVLDEVALDMIKRMKDNRDEKNMLRSNFDTEMNLWALESIGTVALGCRLNVLNPNAAEESPEKEFIKCIHQLFAMIDKLDFKPNLWKHFATPTFKKAMKLFERHETLLKFFLQKGIDQLKRDAGKKLEHEKGILEKLLEINKDYAYVMASDMLFAGVDTAANTVTATLYLLAKNQDKQDILREEILSKSERRPYLRACVKESMRIMPAVSGNLRTTTKEYNLKGYRIPEDFNVVFAHMDMSLMEEQYPRSKEYIPERWIAEKTDPLYYGNAHPFAHGIFGYGVRGCIGRRIAELEIETFLARLIENFKVDWIGPPPQRRQTSLIYFKGPLNFVLTDVQK